MNKKEIINYLVLVILLFLLSSGLSYALFSLANKKIQPDQAKTPLIKENQPQISSFEIDPSIPRTEVCPLNGQLHTQKEKEIWETRRPLGVMVENHVESRPQSGLYHADIVYEAVAEGGITRMMPVFYCSASAFDIQVGPVRSARTYFLDWISEYGDFPLYAHVLGANCNRQTDSGCLNGAPADALGQIRQYGWALFNDLDQSSVGFPSYWKDYERLGRPVASEHTMYSTTTKLWDYAQKDRGLTNQDEKNNQWDENFRSWLFKEETPENKRPQKADLEFTHWQGYQDFTVKYQYDPQTNSYLRFTANTPHLDLNTNKQLQPKTVIIQFAAERRANDGYDNNLHLLYGTIGTGKAKIYQDGQEINATWQKKSRQGRTLFSNAQTGAELKFNPGQIWIHIVPVGTEIIFTSE